MEQQTKRVAIYARVSTKDQTVENQLLDLRRYCAARGWPIVADPFVDHGLSGSLRERPQLKNVLDFVRKRKADILLVWRFDRFARSLSHLVSTLEELRSIGVDFVSFQESVDTSTAQGRLVFGVMASLAEFERELIRERIFSGIRRAREQGKRLGHPLLPDFKVKQILELRGTGSYQQIAQAAGVTKSTAWKVLRVPLGNGQSGQEGPELPFFKPSENVAPVLV